MMPLSPQNFAKIEEFVLNHSGIVLARLQQTGLREKVRKHIEQKNIPSIEDYLYLLNSPGSSSVREELMAIVTVGESFFYRNPGQFRYLAHEFLPALYEKKRLAGCRLIRIWSAGCSTGEEAYSLAHVAQFVHTHLPELNLEIAAGDINRRNLEWAENGLYRKRSLRGQAWEMQNELKIPLGKALDDGMFQVSEELQSQVTFQYQNLRQLESLKSHRGSDIIFCRNVLIYFEDAFRQQLMQAFYDLLNPGGMLFLGETESISGLDGFRLVPCRGAFGYLKG